MARLIVRSGGSIGDIHELGKSIVTIGRDEKCGVRLDVEGVSRNHAQIILEDDRWLVTDLMSTNGTIVNGEKVAEQSLDSPPVWDGIAAANGRLYISLESGNLLSLKSK